MDIDAVHTLAPGASIHVYEFGQGTGGVESFTAYLDAVAAAPRFESVLSISEGACDGTVDTAVLQALDTKLKVLAGQGRTVFASSGDDGASCSGGGVQFPASDPYVTAVGGTSLHVSGGHAQESSWDDGRQGKGGGVGSSGGGTSAYFGRPAWQAGIAPSGKGREVPDVAALGDPTAQGMLFVDTKSWLDGWLERWVMGGGTSLSAPLWAGFGAVYNQYAATHGQSSLGWANPTLYYLGQHPQQRVGAALRDVTLNGRRTTDLAAPAAPGWDQATGWGSFDAAAFVHDRLDARLVVQPIMEVGGPPGLAVLAVATGFVPGEAVAFSAGPGGSKCSAMADQQGTARCRVAVGQGLAGGSQTFKASDAMAMLQATAVWSAASSL
jgi:kumamolisin